MKFCLPLLPLHTPTRKVLGTLNPPPLAPLTAGGRRKTLPLNLSALLHVNGIAWIIRSIINIKAKSMRYRRVEVWPRRGKRDQSSRDSWKCQTRSRHVEPSASWRSLRSLPTPVLLLCPLPWRHSRPFVARPASWSFCRKVGAGCGGFVCAPGEKGHLDARRRP